MAYTPPTADELRRVAEHWRRVEALVCTHETLMFDSSCSGPTCADCQRPLRILSDIQIEQLTGG